ncbi:MAG: dual specificity protein phosphatase family protein [Methylococcaceae bacterium]
MYKFIFCVCVMFLLSGCSQRFSKIPGFDNFDVVEKDILWRGEELDKDKAKLIIEEGARTIVSLLSCDEEDNRIYLIKCGSNDLKSFKMVDDVNKNYNIAYYHIPFKEWTPLSNPDEMDNKVSEFLAIISNAKKKTNTPVYVHCAAGANRTGIMVAAYRIIELNESKEKAIEDMKTRADIFWYNPSLKGYIEGLTLNRIANIIENKNKILNMRQTLLPDAIIHCEKYGKCAVKTDLINKDSL